MAVSNVVRNLRDGELRISDGATPANALTVILDEGNLSWTQRSQTIEIKDRGSIADGHLRRGDQQSTTISFSAKWTQLVGRSANSADPLQLHEVLTFAAGTNLKSTSRPGEENTLQFEFVVTDPAGIASERIVFAKVYRDTLTLREAPDANLIVFSGKDFSPTPQVHRI